MKTVNNEGNVPKNFITLRAEMHAKVIAKAIGNPDSVQAGQARRAIDFFMSSEGKKHLGALRGAKVSRTKWYVIKLRYKRNRSQKRR